MGWSFACDPGYGKKELVRDLTSAAWWGDGWKIIASSLRGNQLWQVIENPDGKRFIALDLLQSGGREMGWGHKDMDESCGPCYYDCPLRFLDMAPEPARNYGWRENVRKHHAERAARAKIAPGAKVVIYGKPYTVERKAPKRGWIVKCEATGRVYRAIKDIQPAA